VIKQNCYLVDDAAGVLPGTVLVAGAAAGTAMNPTAANAGSILGVAVEEAADGEYVTVTEFGPALVRVYQSAGAIPIRGGEVVIGGTNGHVRKVGTSGTQNVVGVCQSTPASDGSVSGAIEHITMDVKPYSYVASSLLSAAVYVVGDILYASTVSELSRLAAVATGNALISGGVSTAPSWGKIGLTTHVSGVLPVANGGTNSSAALNNNRLMRSSGGAVTELGALTQGRVVYPDSNGLPTGAANLFWDATDLRLGINTGGAPAFDLHVVDEDPETDRGICVGQHNGSVAPPIILFRKSRGTFAAPTVVSSGDYGGNFFFEGYGAGGSYIRTSRIGQRITAAPSGSNLTNALFFSNSTTHDTDPYTNGSVRLELHDNGRIGLFSLTGMVPSYDVSLQGETANRTIGLERRTTSNVAGRSLTINAGGATSGATDKNGGNLILAPGTATGTGSSDVVIHAVTAGATGTADRTAAAVLTVKGTGVEVAGNVTLTTAGNGLKIKEGSNATMGQATLVGGTVTVNTTKVTASSRIFLTTAVAGGTLGILSVGAMTVGTSFVINSSSGTDTSTVNWIIIEPAP
jgi:hypothetical protein